MKINKIYIKHIPFLLLLFPLVLFSQKKWTLEECISQASTHNWNMKNARITNESNQELVESSKLNYIPHIGLNASNQTQIIRENDPKTLSYIKTNTNNSTNIGLGLNTELFGGMRKYYALKKSLSDFNISQSETKIIQNNLTLSVIQLYLSILLDKELILSAKKQLEVSDINIEKAERLHKEGLFTEEKLQNLLAQKDQEMYALSSSEGALKTHIIDMCNLLNITDYDTFDVAMINFDLFSETISEEMIQNMVNRMPEIASGEQKITSLEYDTKIIKSSLFPTLSLNLSYSSSFNSSSKAPLLDSNGNYIFLPGNSVAKRDYSIADQLRNNQVGYIGFSLNIPFTNVFQVRKNIKVNKNRIEQAKNNLENNKKELSEKIKKLIVELNVSKSKYESSESAAKRTEIILFHINQKFNGGTISISDYNIAKENLLIAQARVSSAKYEYLLKKKLLEFYLNI